MAHKSIADLTHMLEAAALRVTVGGCYAHYKHPEVAYIVTGLSILEATDEVAVKYVSVDTPTVEFVRALDSWSETIEWNGQHLLRFTPLP